MSFLRFRVKYFLFLPFWNTMTYIIGILIRKISHNLQKVKVVGDLNFRKNILQFEFITESQRENLVLGLVAIVSVVVAENATFIPPPPSLRLQIRTWLGPRKHPAHVVPS